MCCSQCCCSLSSMQGAGARGNTGKRREVKPDGGSSAGCVRLNRGVDSLGPTSEVCWPAPAAAAEGTPRRTAGCCGRATSTSPSFAGVPLAKSGLAFDWSTAHRSSWHREHDLAILAPASSLWALPMLLGIIKKTNAVSAALLYMASFVPPEFLPTAHARTTQGPASG